MKKTRPHLPESRPWSPRLALLLGALLLGLAPARLAAIPAAALADPRYGLGYLVVTNYAGVVPDGVTDCTAGIQNAINDAYAANASYQASGANRGLAVFFSPGTYMISNTLQCYQWSATNGGLKGFHIMVGSTEAGARPLIKLAANAANFQTATNPRSMFISELWLQGTNAGTPYPPAPLNNGPMQAPNGYKPAADGNMGALLRDINFDCNGNPGAIGVVMSGAQYCLVANVMVHATNAFAGFYELPGASGCAANLEVAGGQYGIIQGICGVPPGLYLDVGTAGPVVAGLTLEGQTVASILDGEFLSPMTVIGFKISNSQNIIANSYEWGTSSGVLTLLDGQISINSSTNPAAICNVGPINNVGPYGRDFYIRNVYVSGTTNLVNSGGTITTGSGSGTWNYIAEYSYNSTYKVSNVPPNSNYPNSAWYMNSYSVINGTVQDYRTPFPALTITSNSGAPPTNLVSEHLWRSYPSYNGAASDPPTVVVATNIGWNGGLSDCTLVLQSNIDLAWTNPAYQGRVFLPSGQYWTTNTLTLHTNTVLMGAGWLLSQIEPSQAWKPTGNVSVLQTENSAGATTTLAYLTVWTRNTENQNDTQYSWFNAITWQAGANSLALGVSPGDPWTQWGATQARSVLLFTNNGGGHWYSVCPGYYGNDYASGNSGFRRTKIVGTTQPLWFYGYDTEANNGGGSPIQTEVSGASNVRFVGLKRENSAVSLWITNSSNIAGYSFGFDYVADAADNGYFQVLGTSTNILLANLSVYNGYAGTHNMLYEALNGLPSTNVLWPNFVSLYKRGQIDDTKMFPTTAGLVLTATPDANDPSLQIDLSWNSVSNATGYQLQRSTTNGGPYSVRTNTAATNYSDTGVFPGTAYYYVVSATNSGGPFTNSAQVTAVTQPNAAPTLGPINGLVLITNAPPQTVNLSGISAGANEAGQTLTVTASSSNPGLIPTPTVNYTSPNPTGTLTFTPAANASGMATVTVTVRDNGGTNGGGVDTVTQAFAVTAIPGGALAGNIFSNTVPCSVDINSNLWLSGGSVCSAPAFGSGGIPNVYVMPATNAPFSNTGTATNLVRAYATNLCNNYSLPMTMYFHGDSLSLGSNWLLKLKAGSSGQTNYTAYTFTNSIASASPGLLLNGGMIEDGETISTSLTNWFYGVLGAASGTLSYLSLSENQFEQAGESAHNFYMAATIVGNGNIMLSGGAGAAPSSAGVYNYAVFTNAPSPSTFSGAWIIEGGWMTTAPNAVAGAYGSNCSFIVDNLSPTPVPWGSSATTNSARLDLLIPITSTGTLIVTNSGQLEVNATCAFSAITIAGTSLAANSNYTAATLSALFPNNVVSGGTGALIVGASHPVFSGPVMSGTNLLLTGAGGSPNGAYWVLTSTNPALPLANWTPVLTNSFSGTGSFSNALPMAPPNSQRFYRLRAP